MVRKSGKSERPESLLVVLYLLRCIEDDKYLDVLYADWHNSKVGILFWLGGDSVLSVCYFFDLTYFMISSWYNSKVGIIV